MHNYFRRNRKALSSLAIILLLLIFAIIGGLISYLWVTGYYLSLKEKLPNQDTVAITDLSFNPENATAFNVTVLNPSYSPSDKVEVSEIGYTGQNGTLYPVQSSVPVVPFNVSRGSSQTFICSADLAPYVNQSLSVSVFVVNGSGSTNFIKIPYTQLLIPKIDFNSTVGVKNFTITLQNAPLSAANLTITSIGFYKQAPFNNTDISPTLPLSLAPNKTATLLISGINGNWSSYAASGGSYPFSVSTKEGYTALIYTTIPKLGFSVRPPNFNETDTKHFTVTVRNEGSTNTLNVSRIDVVMYNGTVENVTPTLNSSTNGVLGNSTATFTASWDWTEYRDRTISVGVYMQQGIPENYSQPITTPALSVLNATFPDSQHVLVTVENSQYAAGDASVENITVTLENGTEEPVQIIQPPTSPPYLVGIGNTTMFSASWNWTNYLNEPFSITIYTNEGYSTSYATTTPSNILNYQVYISIPSAPIFNAGLPGFNVTIQNDKQSNGSTTITGIAFLLTDDTIHNGNCTSLPYTLAAEGNETFTCQWSWTNYTNKSIVILVYTNEGLKAIYVTTTPS
jgi:hypothetical protein